MLSPPFYPVLLFPARYEMLGSALVEGVPHGARPIESRIQGPFFRLVLTSRIDLEPFQDCALHLLPIHSLENTWPDTSQDERLLGPSLHSAIEATMRAPPSYPSLRHAGSRCSNI